MHTSHTSDHDAERIKAALHALDWPLLTRLCKQTLRKKPKHLTAHRMLGFSLSKQREADAALAAYRRALVYWPEDGELLANFGNYLIAQALNDEALPLMERLCKLRPDKAICWNELAHCCYALSRHEQGLQAAEKAADLATELTDRLTALTQKAIHRRELGQIKQAVRDCEEAIALFPRGYGNHTNRILFMLADPDTTAVQLAAAAKEYGTIFEQPIKHLWPSFDERNRDPWRKLKIGFLSPDFRGHPVMYFAEGLLARLDRRQFEVYALHLYPRDDMVSKRVENLADHFIRLSAYSHEEQTDIIRKLELDVVIDLAGHTGHNGLQVLVNKVAPLQISWLGFPATTGLKAIDYKFTDDVTDLPDAADQYSEKLYRLPTFFGCYRPHSREPLWRYQPRYLVRPTPALSNGFITFGSCNNLGKLTDEVLSLWGRLIESIPGSRLLIEGKGLHEPKFLDEYKGRCKGLGLNPERVDFVGTNSANQYLTYHRIDIALDPFPLTGGTTSFDLLWMGVPLVSMHGDSFKSRMGTGMLTYLGRPEWLAHDAEGYIAIANQLASDVDALNKVRLGMRHEVEYSVLMREDLFCQHFGDGLRTIWLKWLAEKAWPNDTDAQMNGMQNWLQAMPIELQSAPTPGVGLAPGLRVSIHEAHEKLEAALTRAKNSQVQSDGLHAHLSNRAWIELTELAEKVLSSHPHDPVALACLAEVEFAHGHKEFAVTYLKYATEAMAQNT